MSERRTWSSPDKTVQAELGADGIVSLYDEDGNHIVAWAAQDMRAFARWVIAATEPPRRRGAP